MERPKVGGCRRGPEDHRDFRMAYGAAQLARKVDLRPLCSRVENQARLNSCTANATVGAMEILERKQGMEQVDLSRLFVYYNTRVLDGSVDKDVGSYISNAMRAVKAKGACLESIWQYALGAVFALPSDAAYADGMNRQAVEYARVVQGAGVLQALNGGLPVVYGMMLRESFERTRGDGLVPVPAAGEPATGGHAMLIVGYDLDERTYLVRNSWGEGWGDGGYCRIPFVMVDDSRMSWDFWVIYSMEDANGEVVRPDRGEQHRQIEEWWNRLRRVAGRAVGRVAGWIRPK